MNKDSTQHQPGSSSSSSSSFIVPIRAPLTVDSDSEYYLSSCNSSTTSSVVDISSSFNDDFATYPHDEFVLEQSRFDKCELIRPFVKYPHGNEVKNEIFRPIVKCPDGNDVNDCSGSGKNEIFRTFVKYPDGNDVKNWDGFGKNDVFRPIVKCPDGNDVNDCSGSGKNEIFRPFVKYPDGNEVRDWDGFGKNEVFRPFVKYRDGDSVKDCGGLDKNEIFRPIVKCPDGDNVRDCSDFGENEIFRPIVKYPDGDNVKDCSGFGKNDSFRPIVKYPDGDNVKDCSGFDRNEIFRRFVKYPDGDNVKDCGGFDGNVRHIVKCPDGNDVKDCSDFDKTDIFRPFVKYSDGANVKDCGAFDKGGVFRPIMKCPDGNESKNAKDCYGSDKVGVFRPIVKYPYGYNVQDCGGFDNNGIFRPFMNDPCEETSSGSGNLGVPVARLSGDCDSGSDVDSVDGVVESVVFPPKVKIFSADEGDDELHVEGVVSGDDSSCISELNQLTKNEGCKVECLNEVVKVSGSDEMSYESGKKDAEIASCSGNETISGSEQEVVFDGCGNQSKKIFGYDEGDDIDGSMSGCISDGSIGNEVCKVECLNLVHDLSELNEMSKTVDESEPKLVDVYRTEFKNTLNKVEGETLVKMQPEKSNFLNLLRFLGLLNEFASHLTILAIGETGVGKSATINSIFGENKASTNAFNPGTSTIQQIVGTIEGIELRVIDTPGLKSSPFERSHNLKILKSIKRLAKKHTPDVVLYVDRLDTHTRGDDDSHLLRLITSSLGSSIWRNCIIALTNASSSPTDESLRGFVFQRCRLLQEKIHKHGCTNDEHMVNPVWLVENHPSYKNDESRLLEVSDYLRHNIVLDDGLDGLVCFDRANEPLSYQKAVVNCSVERRKAYFEDYSYRVKLLGTKHWYVACRLCS